MIFIMTELVRQYHYRIITRERVSLFANLKFTCLCFCSIAENNAIVRIKQTSDEVQRASGVR